MASIDCSEWSACVVIVSKSVCVLKYFTGLFPRSMLRIGQLPSLCVWRISWSSVNVLLSLEVLSFALYLHPNRRCVLVRVAHIFFIASALCYVFVCSGIRVFPRPLHMSPVGICLRIVSALVCCSICPSLLPFLVVRQIYLWL